MELHIAAPSDMPLIKSLYTDTFPKEERQDFDTIISFTREKRAVIYSIFENTFAGFVITLEDDSTVLINYFAMLPEMRCRGIGGRIITELTQRYAASGKRVFLEIETVPTHAAADDVRTRRRDFYRRCGYRDADICVRVFSCRFELMTHGGAITFDEYRNFLRSFFGQRIYERIREDTRDG
ncbi:MAG TPA: GNAT family N-acetyltransferase [Bacillota bacterium]|nr:GNAT family N-acetyltransferase [Bacillota bacterium]